MFWMRNKENNFPIRTLIWRPVLLSKMIAEIDRTIKFLFIYCNSIIVDTLFVVTLVVSGVLFRVIVLCGDLVAFLQ